MDIEETLRQLRVLMKQSHEYEIVERFEALDEWLSKGGCLPTDWCR